MMLPPRRHHGSVPALIIATFALLPLTLNFSVLPTVGKHEIEIQQIEIQQNKPERVKSKLHIQTSFEESKKSQQIFFFQHGPEKFSQTLADCLIDEFCHVLFHHIPKSAGTFIASTLHPLFENGDMYKSQEWCCYEKVMERFYNATDYYCLQRKLGIYEVWGNEFSKVLHTCQDNYGVGSVHVKSQKNRKPHRYVALVATREPIQRTVSLIHQQCNSGYSKHNPTFQSFCRECHYNEGSRSFWRHFVEDTNRAFRTMASYIQEFQQGSNGTSEGSGLTAPLLILDNSMVDDFFAQLQSTLGTQPYEKELKLEKGNHNPESRSICDFGISSSMMKELKPASTLFINLWSGKLLAREWAADLKQEQPMITS